MNDGCPACGDNGKQQRVGVIGRDEPTADEPPVLYRCGECGFLYTIPRLDESRAQE